MNLTMKLIFINLKGRDLILSLIFCLGLIGASAFGSNVAKVTVINQLSPNERLLHLPQGITEFLSHEKIQILNPDTKHPEIGQFIANLQPFMTSLLRPTDKLRELNIVVSDDLIFDAFIMKPDKTTAPLLLLSLGLIQFIESDDELAVIVRHEINHLQSSVQKHNDNVNSNDPLKYRALSRAIETEMDVRAVSDVLTVNHYNPYAIIHFFRRLQKDSPKFQFGLTHPDNSARIHSTGLVLAFLEREMGTSSQFRFNTELTTNILIGPIKKDYLESKDFADKLANDRQAVLNAPINQASDLYLGVKQNALSEYEDIEDTYGADFKTNLKRLYQLGLAKLSENEQLDFQLRMHASLLKVYETVRTETLGDHFICEGPKQYALLHRADQRTIDLDWPDFFTSFVAWHDAKAYLKELESALNEPGAYRKNILVRIKEQQEELEELWNRFQKSQLVFDKIPEGGHQLYVRLLEKDKRLIFSENALKLIDLGFRPRHLTGPLNELKTLNSDTFRNNRQVLVKENMDAAQLQIFADDFFDKRMQQERQLNTFFREIFAITKKYLERLKDERYLGSHVAELWVTKHPQTTHSLRDVLTLYRKQAPKEAFDFTNEYFNLVLSHHHSVVGFTSFIKGLERSKLVDEKAQFLQKYGATLWNRLDLVWGKTVASDFNPYYLKEQWQELLNARKIIRDIIQSPQDETHYLSPNTRADTVGVFRNFIMEKSKVFDLTEDEVIGVMSCVLPDIDQIFAESKSPDEMKKIAIQGLQRLGLLMSDPNAPKTIFLSLVSTLDLIKGMKTTEDVHAFLFPIFEFINMNSEFSSKAETYPPLFLKYLSGLVDEYEKGSPPDPIKMRVLNYFIRYAHLNIKKKFLRSLQRKLAEELRQKSELKSRDALIQVLPKFTRETLSTFHTYMNTFSVPNLIQPLLPSQVEGKIRWYVNAYFAFSSGLISTTENTKRSSKDTAKMVFRGFSPRKLIKEVSTFSSLTAYELLQLWVATIELEGSSPESDSVLSALLKRAKEISGWHTYLQGKQFWQESNNEQLKFMYFHFKETALQFARWQIESRFAIEKQAEALRVGLVSKPKPNEVRPLLHNIFVYLKAIFDDPNEITHELVHYLEEKLVITKSESALISEFKLNKQNWMTSKSLYFVDGAQAMDSFLANNQERWELLQFLTGLTSTPPKIHALEQNSFLHTPEKLWQARRQFLGLNLDIKTYALQPLLDSHSGLLSDPTYKDRLNQLVLGDYAKNTIVNKIYSVYMSTLPASEQMAVLARFFSLRSETQNTNSGLSHLLRALGPFGVRAGQFLRTSGLLSSDQESELDNIFDRPEKPDRDHLFARLTELFGEKLHPIEYVGPIVGSGSLNIAELAKLRDPNTHQERTVILQMRRDHVVEKIQSENQIWIEVVKQMSQDPDLEVQRAALLLDEARRHSFDGLQYQSPEIDARKMRSLYKKAKSAYQKSKPFVGGIEIEVASPLFDLQTYIPKELQDSVTIFDYVPNTRFFDLAPVLQARVSEWILEAEFKALFEKGIFDPDGHPGNWLFDADKNRLVRIDYAQLQVVPTAKMNLIKSLLSTLGASEMNPVNVKRLTQLARELFELKSFKSSSSTSEIQIRNGSVAFDDFEMQFKNTLLSADIHKQLISASAPQERLLIILNEFQKSVQAAPGRANVVVHLAPELRHVVASLGRLNIYSEYTSPEKFNQLFRQHLGLIHLQNKASEFVESLRIPRTCQRTLQSN